MAEIIYAKEYLSGQLHNDFQTQYGMEMINPQKILTKAGISFIVLFVLYLFCAFNQESYIYSYSRGLTSNNLFIITNDLFFWLSLVISIQFSIIAVFICQAGYSIRREQYCLRRIQTGKNMAENSFRQYGKSYINLFFLPDLYFILFLFIFITMTAMILWTSFLLNLSLILIFTSMIPYPVMLGAYFFYLVKYRDKCKPAKIRIESLIPNFSMIY